MLFSRLPTTLFLCVAHLFTSASASSVTRNPLKQISEVLNPSISTKDHYIHAYSNFDITFDAFKRHMKVTLEPNNDILLHEPNVQYLNEDGEVVREEKINRLDHKVFKGDTWWQNLDSTWERVGWARITVHEDGRYPLFEGAFTVNHDHHHVRLASQFAQTKHELDPHPIRGEEHMVIYRDSDKDTGEMHWDLRRDAKYGDRMAEVACPSDQLEYNMDLSNPIYSSMSEPESESQWGVSLDRLFSKRQIDTGTGVSGNGAGVNLVQSIGSTTGCPNTRKIALVGVAYDCTYAQTFNSSSTAKQNIIAQMNSASNLYETTFNISLGLANLTVNDAACPASAPASAPWNVPCSNSVTIQDRLNLFSAWRGRQNDQNSHWTLLTNCPTGSAVGLAWLGQACILNADSRNSSAGAQTVSGANVVAKTTEEWQVIAHETGHTFGAVHDCTTQTCSDGTSTAQQCCPLSSSTCNAGQRYIMNPSTAQGISTFSPCTIGNICSAMGRNSVKTSCFSSNKGVTLSTGPVCGNGIVEQGEDCDCGGTAGCGNNPCCDATTCKYKATAVCDDSNEDCCKNCQLASASTVCRASTGTCDPAETCTGTTATCPADVTAPDGQDCGNGLKCASGHCTSRDQQCKTLMGSYTQGNDTYACDTYSCALSCASPEFGPGVCYGLQQNFLDGTPCGGGGTCSNVSSLSFPSSPTYNLPLEIHLY